MKRPVPPLPPVPSEALTLLPGPGLPRLLLETHYRLRLLCTDLAAGRDVLDPLTATAVRHLSAEEQYVYPALRPLAGDAVADAELAHDTEILATLRELNRAPREDLVDRLTTQLSRHAHRAASELIPLLRLHCTEEELVRLGNRLVVAEEAAPTRPHLATPSRPPWNKIVDPGLGVVDKLRDALTLRRTR